ncbi:MAG: glycosyltransferase [Thermicanus sp.]|nr:glycosyltransferase [Thermicanus sp.]
MEPQKMKLLLFSTYGGGHWQAARAIGEAFKLRHSHVEVEVINFMEYTPPPYKRRERHLFLKMLRHHPYVYKYAFQWTHSINLFPLQRWVTLTTFRRVFTALEEKKPSAVVSTHPLPAGVMSAFKWYGLTKVPTITVITDHTDHRLWISPLTDHYLVGSEDVKNRLIAAGLKEDKVTVTGIPIRPSFSRPHSRYEACLKYDLEMDVPTLLIMGGNWGLIKDGVEMVRLLDQLPMPLQIFFICGNNDTLWEDLIMEEPKLKNRLIITRYIDEVDQVMAASHLIITKAGGITTTEAIAMEVPILLYNPLPGQEEENVKFLLEAGVALLAKDLHDLVNQVEKLLHEPERLEEMRERERSFPFKQSSLFASDVILSVMQSGGEEPEKRKSILATLLKR